MHEQPDARASWSGIIWRRFGASPLALVGLVIVLGLFAIATLGPAVIGAAGLRVDLTRDLAPPGFAGWLGRGENGVDVLTWLIHGARVSLWVSVCATVVSLVIGTAYGLVAGFVGGKLDALCMKVVDVLLAFPGLLLAMYIAAVLQPSIVNVVLALCSTGWVGYARLARAQTLKVKQLDYVRAARAVGVPRARMLWRCILPNIVDPLIVQASFGFSSAILAEAALSFLGLGVAPGTPSWGSLLQQGVTHLFTAPHIALCAGTCIAAAVLGFNFVGDGLRDAVDPRGGDIAQGHLLRF
ncbi:MAG: ABC transporter permease, partial [Myxococcota bacterium]